MKHKWTFGFTLAFSLAGLTLLAQDPNPPGAPPSGGWRRFDQSNSPDAPPPPEQRRQQLPPQRYQEPPQGGPVSLTVPAGTWITVRMNEPLSSDHNQSGDSFTATLAEPVVANGHIVARRGQMIGGVVS
ncbi:MAG TPA: hypothetical protein VEU96_14225, partial [Bryobacteraceae bacterium]|nr:hypothetical protein [Bryobacteraceae bacterium]